MIGIIVAGGLGFLFVLFSTSIGVNYFKTRNIGQPIREELNFHEHKKGTPTMGGVFIILGTFVGFILSHINFWTIGKGFKVELLSINPKIFNLLLLGTLMGFVGFFDDYLKVYKNRNLGLSARNEFILQSLVALLASYYFYFLNDSTIFYLFSGFGIDVGIIKWFLIIFIIVGITNADDYFLNINLIDRTCRENLTNEKSGTC